MPVVFGARGGVLAAALLLVACGEASADRKLAASPLVHLADALDETEISTAPAPPREQRVWRFDQPQPEWHAVSAEAPPSDGPVEPWRRLASVTLEPRPDALRVALAHPELPVEEMLVGGLAIDVEKLRLSDWSALLVRARASERLFGISVACNLDEPKALPGGFEFFGAPEGTAPVFSDGSVQDYILPLTRRGEHAADDDALRSVGVLVGAPMPAALEILSVTLVPRGADFVLDHGVRAITRGEQTRWTLYAHVPAEITWQLAVPPAGRLDLGLACLPGESVAYRIAVGDEVLLEESVADSHEWQQRSLDLSRWAGSEIDLTFSASSEPAGGVALWGAPVLSGAGESPRPNVIFYVIDGGGADLMSVYGYARKTTPFLERLAAEGVVFERAFSNATWTQPSTASFMTSLQHSVLGGLRRGVHSTPVPAAATTMAEHMRRGGYQTGVLTSNPNAARVIGLERGVDELFDAEPEEDGSSAALLHDKFWDWRERSPGRPYWAHFQTTDVHEPNDAPAPFDGLFVTPEQVAQLEEWDGQLWSTTGELFGTTSIAGWYEEALLRTNVPRAGYFGARRGRYDETMVSQDHELERFVDELKARGEWEDTLLVIGADHGHPAGTFARWGRGEFDPQPEPWQGALCDSYSTRVPLIVVWPRGIAGGRRISTPVSMIDVLPTLLDLCGLPPAEVAMGRSLAPLLRGEEKVASSRPVFLEEVRVDEATGEMIGNIEVVDGKWGASLEVGPAQDGRHAIPAGGRWGAVHPFFAQQPKLLLYDLESDPFTKRAVNDEHPELVEKYRALLEKQWEAHCALAGHFHEVADVALDPDQLEQLRELGYIR